MNQKLQQLISRHDFLIDAMQKRPPTLSDVLRDLDNLHIEKAEVTCRLSTYQGGQVPYNKTKARLTNEIIVEVLKRMFPQILSMAHNVAIERVEVKDRETQGELAEVKAQILAVLGLEVQPGNVDPEYPAFLRKIMD